MTSPREKQPKQGANSQIRNLKWNVIKTVIAIILLTAAGIKTAHTDEIIAMDGMLSSQPLLLSTIALEAAIAAHILVAPAKSAWLAATLTFSVLAVTAAFALITRTSCHCFGNTVGAELTLPLDLAILAALGVFRPDAPSQNQSYLNGRLVVPLIFAFVFFGLASIQQEQPSDIDWQDLELLVADQMIGRVWPLTQSADGELEQLKSGSWLVLLVRQDCEHCQELLEREFADPLRHRNDEGTAIFIAGENAWPVLLNRIALVKEGDTSIAWPKLEPFFASPAVFCLSEGKVISAADGQNAAKFLADLFRSK